MTLERMEEIFEEDNIATWEGDNAFKGLLILQKYTNDLIQGADHDIIYSEDCKELIKAGITEEDCIALRNLNWMIENNSLACYV
jgi:hypothetical protein